MFASIILLIYIFIDHDYEYNYNSQLYTNIDILSEYYIYENDYIKFLYPKNFQEYNSKTVNENRIFLFDDTINTNYSITINKEDNKPYIFRYKKYPEKLINFVMKTFHIDKTTDYIETNIFKEIYNNELVFVIETIYENKIVIVYMFESNENYIDFSVEFPDNVQSNEAIDIILNSILIK